MADSTILVSFVVPSYNEEEAIETALSQINDTMRTLRELEVIVVDDGSSDDTARRAALVPGVKVISTRRTAAQARPARPGSTLRKAHTS